MTPVSTERRVYEGSLQPRGFPALPADWTSFSDSFPSLDGKVQLFAAIHHKKGWGKGRGLVILHGMGEHGGRYLHVPHYLHDQIDAIYCMDFRGHGRSGGLRGHVEKFDSLADDAAAAVRRFDELLGRNAESHRLHLLGHSLGGHVALRTAFLHPDLPLASLNISAPFLGIPKNVPLAKRLGARALSKIWGSLQLDTGLPLEGLSHDAEVVEAYKADRLVHGKMTPHFYAELTRAFDDTLKRNSGVQTPVLFLIPLADSVVDPEKSVAFAEALKGVESKVVTFPELRHEPFNDIGKEKVFAELASWISAHS